MSPHDLVPWSERTWLVRSTHLHFRVASLDEGMDLFLAAAESRGWADLWSRGDDGRWTRRLWDGLRPKRRGERLLARAGSRRDDEPYRLEEAVTRDGLTAVEADALTERGHWNGD